MAGTITLICWVIDTPTKQTFAVRVGHDAIWDDVKDAIKKKKEPEFNDIAADTLDLWKVTIGCSKLSLESEDFLRKVKATNPLDPAGPLSTDLNYSLPDDDIDIIIVQRPQRLYPSGITRDKTRKVTPSSEVLELDVLLPDIQKALDIIHPEIEKFLANPELPEWVPQSTIPNVSEYLQNLRIPAYQDGSPSLLFHNLSSQNANEIFDQTRNTFVCNTSGSGKTRLILEGLIKYWGLYFVVARDENNVGVDDLENALKDIRSYEDWTDDLRAVKKVLAARLVVFKSFLQLAEARDGNILPEHRRIWLLFQLRNPLPGFVTPHPFITMRNCLDRASDSALRSLIDDFELVHRQYLSMSAKFFITLDEAQVVSRLHRFSFLSSNRTKSRSTLREIVKVFSVFVSVIFSQIVVSGTGLSLEDVEEDLTSSVGKRLERLGRFKTFVDFGMLDNPQKLEATLRKYIPPFILESDSGKSLQLRIREYLPGRYRFLVSFLELLLMNGMESPHTLLNEYLSQFLLGLPGDIAHATPFTSYEPPLHIQVRIGSFGWERLRQNFRQVVAIIQSHLTKGSTPTFGPLSHKHVEYGIARLRADHQGEIIEPLAFLSVVRWLETQKDLCLEENLIHKLADETRGYAFEEVVILFLLRTFCRPMALNSVFKFHGTVPEWAGLETYTVGHINDKEVPVNILEDLPRNPSLGVVHYGNSIEDIIQWLKESPTSSVLVPSHLFGPDMIIKCYGGVLLMGQAKSYLDGNINELDAATVTKALKSLNSVNWFKATKSLELRQKLISTLQEFRILRFIAGCPLPPNLDLTAESVMGALSDLGQVPLAIIPMDTLRAKFVSPGEVRNILQPMEYALSRKRKRD